MGFLAPWFLAGLAAVGLPIWLHLLKKHRMTPLHFSSLMFFERRTQSSIKHRRLQYLVLFALRTLLVVLLVLAFAKPFVMSSGGVAATGRKLVVLAIDNSFSMRQGDRLDRARQEARRVLAGVGGQDRVQVVAFAGQVRMMGDHGIETIEPTDERSSYAELARALRSIAQSAQMPVEAHVFSDMQKSSLPANFADLRLADGIRLIPHAVASKRLPNFAVESVNVPRRIYGSGKVRLQATIAGYGTERATRRVTVVLNGREVESKSVEVPPDGRATAEFLSLEAPYGLNKGEVRIDSGDAFAADDRFNFSVERADPRDALFVHDARNARGLLYFKTALDAAMESAFRLDAVTPDQTANLALSKYAFVVLSDVGGLPGEFETALRKYVRDGGSLLVTLGRMSAVRHRVPVFDEGIAGDLYSAREGQRFQTAAWLDPGHPSIRRANQWGDVKFYQAVRVTPGKARVAARLSDDTPLLLDKQLGEGRMLVFASTFDNISNDFPLHASFVPFIEQTARYLGRMEDRQANYQVDSWLELRSAREQGATIEVLDPQGRRVLTLAESTRAQNVQLTSAGYYDVRRPSGRHELVAVNPDRHESDFEVIPADTLALWQNTATASRAASSAAEQERRPVPYWWYVLIVALVVSVAESLLGNRHLSVEKEGV